MRPRLPELALRLLLSAVFVLWLSLTFGADLARWLQPAVAACVERLDGRFLVQRTLLVEDVYGQQLRLEVNLSAPVSLGGRVIEPFGTGHMPAGGYRVNLTIGGMWEYVDVLFIAVLAWPARGYLQRLKRTLLALALAALLWLLQVPATLAAELWSGLSRGAGASGVAPLMVWSRFLMGGGGAALALLFAALAIRLGDRIGGGFRVRPGRRTDHPGTHPGR